EVLATTSATPFSAVVVGRVREPAAGDAVLTRRRWIAGGLREDIHLHNTSPRPQTWSLRLELAADFAHVFDVKQGLASSPGVFAAEPGGWRITSPDADAAVRVRTTPAAVTAGDGVLEWKLE